MFGIAFTALLQSSSSSTVIFQAFAIQGLLSYNVAVYLVIGAAIGSVTPNLLASLTANRNGKRAAILNLLFNVFRAGILIALINIFPIILTGIQSLSPNDIGRQLANTHTIFAIIAVLVELPFTGKLIWLAEKIVPVLPEENQQMEDRSLVYMTQLTKYRLRLLFVRLNVKLRVWDISLQTTCNVPLTVSSIIIQQRQHRCVLMRKASTS